ncbi:MAG: DUF2249 domain-containing protein [Acidimicrobiia bacterium]|nr:DUF2249 domain-containing protein [Acidimicrobiia bacterium]
MDLLDVRDMAPAQRHPTIFGALDALGNGETLRLVNDHDPAPLRFQLEATRPREYTWTPVESGPDQWSVDIACRSRTVDARPIIAAGDEPFGKIMTEARALGDDEVLVVYAPFEPVPLFGKLAAMGLSHDAEALDGGDFRVTFRRG